MAQILIIFQVLLMNWYITKIVFAITREDSQSRKQFDEQLRLIAAENPEEAFLKARSIGLGEEDCFYNDKNKKVKWEFINVSEVIPLKGLEDGAEVYSRIHETEEGSSYIHLVHQKAIDIRLTTLMSI
ncbi:MAG TPA: DUF4288 domain-containing protein [Chryseolinea sp.]|nr:DUF4288 domain-containing protein [Chryseolinea sp.]